MELMHTREPHTELADPLYRRRYEEARLGEADERKARAALYGTPKAIHPSVRSIIAGALGFSPTYRRPK